MTNYNDPFAGSAVPVVRGGGAPIFSAFSIIAVIAALASLFATGGGLSFLLAIVAIIFGLLGMAVAFLPSRRGGIVSFVAVGAGLLGIVIAVFKLIGGNPQGPAGY